MTKILFMVNNILSIESNNVSNSKFVDSLDMIRASVVTEDRIHYAGKTDEGGELTEKEIIRAERNSGVISSRVREIQVSENTYIFQKILQSFRNSTLWL